MKKAPALAMIFLLLMGAGLVGTSTLPNPLFNPDSSGVVSTYRPAGPADLANPFFQVLGTNGRSCVTCHAPSDGWTVTPSHLQARFLFSQGMDPIFRPVDGAVCPSADVSTLAARQQAYRMLLSKGVIRVSIGVPQGADFSVTGIEDPYNCPENTAAGLALFRRPLPGASLPFLTTVMWDGRESLPGKSLRDDLKDQALGATLGHAQASQPPTDAQLNAIVDLEIGNFTAQAFDRYAGNLSAKGATGGPLALSQQPFYVGINDPLGGNPTGAAFNPAVFTLFSPWKQAQTQDGEDENHLAAARLSIARGEDLFNTHTFTISGVAGLNDKPGVPASFTGTCTTCHDAPNVGNHSVPLPINIGVADYPALPALDTAGLPVYTIQCDNGQPPVRTTDPGRALISGKCADVGKFKGPILRGLAARAPYFHNGSARTLDDVVNFYEQRFGLNLTDEEKRDLVAFLKSL